MSISLNNPIARIAKVALPVVAVGILAAACASSGGSSSTSAKATTGSTPGAGATSSSIVVKGGHLTNSAGRTVYLWMADTAGKSTCAGACAAVWTPVPGSAKAGTGVTATKLTTVTRSNGGTQLVYAGHPLYYFAGDKSAGQATGDGLNDFGAKWWELNAAGRALTSNAKGGTAPKPSSSSSGSGGYVY